MKDNSAGTQHITDNRPQWYKRAESGPFVGDNFTPELISSIESVTSGLNRIPSHRLRRRKMIVWTVTPAILILGGAILWNSSRLNDEIAAPTTQQQVSASPLPTATVLPPNTAIFDFGTAAYYTTLRQESDRMYTHAALTSEGIVWSPAPERIESGNMDDHATEQYRLYLNDTNEHELSTASSNLIYTFPLTVRIEQAQQEAHMELYKIIGVGPHVVLVTSAKIPGAAQPSEEKLWALDVNEAVSGEQIEPKEIVSFHSVGGSQFVFGMETQRQELVYIYSTLEGSDGEYKEEAKVYRLETGETSLLTTYSISKDQITYTIDGETQKTDQIFK